MQPRGSGFVVPLSVVLEFPVHMNDSVFCRMFVFNCTPLQPWARCRANRSDAKLNCTLKLIRISLLAVWKLFCVPLNPLIENSNCCGTPEEEKG